jgi:hypothetical protein
MEPVEGPIYGTPGNSGAPNELERVINYELCKRVMDEARSAT